MEQHPYNMGISERDSGTSNFPYTPRQDSISTRPSQSNSETRPFINEGITDFLGQLESLGEEARLREEEEELAKKEEELAKQLAEEQAKRDKKARPVWVKVKDKLRKRSKPGSEQVPDLEDPESVEEEEPLDEKHAEDADQETEDDLVGLAPSPYVRPLQYSLSPRHEVYMNVSDAAMGSEIDLFGGITRARHRAETHVTLFGPLGREETVTALKDTSTGANQVEGASNDMDFINSQPSSGTWKFPNHRDPLFMQDGMPVGGHTSTTGNAEFRSEEMSSSPAHSHLGPQPVHHQETYTDRWQRENLHELVRYLSQSMEDFPLWRQYLESYCSGHFNMICPPPPPRGLSENFKFLPAPFQPGESIRIQMSHGYDILWPQWGQQKASDLIRLAMTKFGTKCVSLSFFDERNEIFKAENGYNLSQLDRPISLGSHCLLSKDVLVVLDTKEDWRFTNNPLVVQFPKIRFWAGAPMMAPCGEVLGVFAIFSNKPRTSFTPSERRELAEFTSAVMQDLQTQVEALRLTPLVDRDTFIEMSTRPRSVTSATESSRIESVLVPQGLIFPTEKTPKPQQSRVFHSSASRDPLVHPREQTPPSSAESNNGYFEIPSSLITQDGHSSEEFGMSRCKSFNNSMASYPSGLDRSWTPRPFSSSQLTSVGGDPPNTPAGSVAETDLSTAPNFEVSWADFTKLTDEECAEPYEETEPIPFKTRGRNDAGQFGRTPVVGPATNYLKTIASRTSYHQHLGTNGSENASGGTHQNFASYERGRVLNHQESFTSGTSGIILSQKSATKTTGGVLFNVPLGRESPHTTFISNGLRKADTSPLINLDMSSESEGTTFGANE